MTVIQNDGVGLGSNVVTGDGNDETVVIQDGPGPKNGSQNADVVVTGDGNDLVKTNAGHDNISLGIGNDQANGGGGNDVIDGGDGNDKLKGQKGNDHIDGGDGDDRVYGGGGRDRLDGGADNDTVYGGTGSDAITGGAGDDLLFGSAANGKGAGEADLFVFGDADGNDVVADFEDGVDKFMIDGSTAHSFSYNFDSDGNIKSTVMTVGSTTVTFRNVEVTDDDLHIGTIGDFFDTL